MTCVVIIALQLKFVLGRWRRVNSSLATSIIRAETRTAFFVFYYVVFFLHLGCTQGYVCYFRLAGNSWKHNFTLSVSNFFSIYSNFYQSNYVAVNKLKWLSVWTWCPILDCLCDVNLLRLLVKGADVDGADDGGPLHTCILHLRACVRLHCDA